MTTGIRIKREIKKESRFSRFFLLILIHLVDPTCYGINAFMLFGWLLKELLIVTLKYIDLR